ncbi:PAS/PAC sensor-containing diguanylate cyclase/phosphodiesterase [Caballeronia cordobensis]|uniref:PAS/PAC sensor-containing diguanylate cyclase/phosphodiesterase n=1 Tax=Caballeronia cordobensis TaxID=1353886 RepID=A0A158J7U9_CABCO|nr:diguanylate cyclase [Caballeronia cordobensis]SAL65012.1 PAS/PAC sensor-containing diguanylate cyclase/phosphodiesterase [Caballeronia cordobensis]
MKLLTRIYRGKIVGVVSAGGIALIALIAFGLLETSKLESNVAVLYAGNIAPVSELDAIRIAEMDMRRQFWRALALRNPDVTTKAIQSIRGSIEKLDRAWSRYFPVGISSAEERALANVLVRDLPRFKDIVKEGVALLADARYDAASKWLDSNIDFMDRLDTRLGQDIAVNTRQAERFAQECASIVNTTFMVGSGFVGAVLLLVAGLFFYLLRERNDVKRETRYHLWMANRVFEHASNGVMVINKNGLIERINPGFTILTGYTQDEVIGRSPCLLNSGRQNRTFYEDLWHRLNETGHWKGEVWNRGKDGRIYLESMSMSGIRDRDGHYSHFVAFSSDVTQRQLEEERLSYLATHDALTGLLNRAQFGEHLRQAILRAKRKLTRVALLFIDLDGFKQINDTLGHGVGDLVLKTVASRIRQSLRESDVIARFGGDEFTVILEDITDPQDVARIAHNLVASIGRPMDIDSTQARVTTSVGISLFPDHGAGPNELLKRADMAMYEAKDSGKNDFQFCALTEDATAMHSAEDAQADQAE